MIDETQVAALLQVFPGYAGDPELIARIRGAAVRGNFKRGQSICHEGDRCGHLALVLAGAARIYKLAESGREITLYRVEPGECCILTASCMLSGRRFPADATVDADLDALLIREGDVVAWMAVSETWRHFLWNLLAERFGGVISLIEEVAFRRMDRRLGEYLVQHAGTDGRRLEATHQQIAADLGTSREVVSRILKDFESRGLLSLRRGSLTLDDLDGLRAIGAERD